MSISGTADTSDPENGIFVQVATPRPRPKSTSQQIPSDEDTDSDYDDVYTNGIPRNNKSAKSKNKKQKSQYAPLDKHKKQMKIYIIATVLCVAIIALLLVFMIDILFTDSNNSTSITNAPYNINTTTNLESPTYIPTYLPSSHPSLGPAIFPTMFPSQNPSTNPSHSPSFIPTATPTYTPSQNPSTNPTKLPTKNPTVTPTQSPSINPSTSPSHNPSRSPTTNPSVSPSTIPSQTPTNNPSLPPTQNPTISTGTPSVSPTPSPITMILQRGNDIYDQDITMNFPENAFPDSILTINIGQAAPTTQQIFDDTTTAFKAMSVHNITNNAIHFSVEHNPLQLAANISYKTTIPIPADLLRQCPSHYGYEIFTQIQQNELIPTRTFPIFVLFESLYNPTAQSLTTWLFPEMFSNQNADIILSCTPGKNIVPVRRRNLLQNPNGKTLCKAAEIICPVESGCVVLNPFGRHHYGVDYALQSNMNIISAANGVVERSGSSAVYGNVIIIRNEDGSAAIYADLSENLVFLGDAVRQGQVIAIGGSMYFHFEYIANGEIYQTKKRINPNDCFASPWPTQSGGGDGTGFPTLKPTKPPLVAPNTYSPTIAPTLVTGSITVRDSGRLPDDAFAVYIDGFKVCETEVGHPNTCAISFLRPGLHTLTLEVIIAPDTFGTFYVALSNGWKFTDGTNSTTFEDDTTSLFPVGWQGSWDFTVPFPDVPVPP